MIICYVDGLCESAYEGGPQNPGGVATYGYRIEREDGSFLAEGSGVIGEGGGMTSVGAEYEALSQALSYLLNANITSEKVDVRSDNRQLVYQMKGDWKIRRGAYIAKYESAKALVSRFSQIDYTWIPRESNIEADELSRRAYRRYISERVPTGGSNR